MSERQLDPDHWVTEAVEACGTAMSLRIKGKLEEKQSPFQKVSVYETTDFGNLMLIDGCAMVSTRENFLYHEMISHPALFTHEAPRDVVIIGGGDCGTLREVLKHPDVTRVVQVDIDEVVTELALKHFPELCASNDDERATLLFDDGVRYVAEADERSVDVVIVDSTDPAGPGEGLFNRTFYANCLRMLRDGGILVQQSESPLLHMKLILEMRAAMTDVGFADLQTLTFPQMIYPSGWWSCTLARKGKSFVGFRERDANAAAFRTEYYNVDVHRGAMANPNFMRRAFGQLE
jgi:spermidine synthase